MAMAMATVGVELQTRFEYLACLHTEGVMDVSM